MKVNNNLEVRAIPHYKAGSDFELIGYCAVLVKTCEGMIAIPNLTMSKAVASIFRNNYGKSQICYVLHGMVLTTDQSGFYKTPKEALDSIQ